MHACVHMCEHVIISKKGGRKFEREKGGVYERVWMEKREGENCFIIILKIKEKW